jgi:hypothetical protein
MRTLLSHDVYEAHGTVGDEKRRYRHSYLIKYRSSQWRYFAAHQVKLPRVVGSLGLILY